MKTNCPECKTNILLDEGVYDDGDELVCPKCEIMLAVVKQNKKLCLTSDVQNAFESAEDNSFLLETNESDLIENTVI